MRYLRLYEELGGNGCPLDNDLDKQEIMDLCEPFMIPLMDDDIFDYGILSRNIGRYPFVVVYIAFRNSKNLGYSSKKYEYTLDHLLKDGEIDDTDLYRIELRVRL